MHIAQSKTSQTSRVSGDAAVSFVIPVTPSWELTHKQQAQWIMAHPKCRVLYLNCLTWSQDTGLDKGDWIVACSRVFPLSNTNFVALDVFQWLSNCKY